MPKIGFRLVALVGVTLLALAQQKTAPKKQPWSTWSDYAGGADNMQYSALTQVNKTNVKQLEQVWFYPTGIPHAFNPLVVDGAMYVVGKANTIVALDVATGKEIWNHPTESAAADRGINYWESADRKDRRLIYTADSYLQEIDTRTGVTIPSFGNDGKVNLREGLERDPKTIARIQSNTPGHVFENLIILGSATGEAEGSPPGDLRAYDVKSGKLVWQFHTVPHPGEFGYDTWPKNAWRYIGGVNTWGDFSIDEKRGIAYFPTGSPTWDFYGADRIGMNLFSDCLLALDARTGKRLWHFQMVHHDLWDFDGVAAPKLLTVRHNGKMVDVVAQATKQGFLYVFDRVTGQPLWPVEERPVPKSDMPGEQAWPTQPFPTKPPAFARQSFTAADLNPYNDDPADVAHWKEIFAKAHNQGLFTPPSMEDTIQIPGNNGGANFGAAAGDPKTGMMYVISKDAPCLLILSERGHVGDAPNAEQQGHELYNQQCESCHGSQLEGHIGPSLQGVVNRLGAASVQAAITNGKGNMPAIRGLSSESVELITAYLANPALGDFARPPDPNAPPPRAYIAGGPGRGPQPPQPVLPFPPGIKRYQTPYGTMAATNGLPAIGPPAFQITAYDLNEGTIKWQIPLGTVPSLAAKGITDTGSYWPRGGPIVTAGGLVFANSCGDLSIHAYDKDNGQELWKKELEACPQGMPATFESGGRQYVAFSTAIRANDNLGINPKTIAVKQPKPEALGYYVFALPKR